MKRHLRPNHTRGIAGFTLVELLVSVAILGIMMVLMSSMLTQANKVWSYNKAKTDEYREARNAFNAMTTRLSQATLNTYYDYVDSSGNTRASDIATGGANGSYTFIPAGYSRISELRFISGQVAGPPVLVSPTGSYTPYTHAVFFQAPIGYSTSSYTGTTTVQGLGNLLNTWGYYIEYGPDPRVYPSFAAAPARIRFRLMELMEPTEFLSVYKYTSGPSGGPSIKTTDANGNYWFTNPLSTVHPTTSGSEAHVLADNVIALILLPKLSPGDDSTGTLLAPNYNYDSTSTGNIAGYPANPGLVDSKAQLPPVVQVSLVSISEDSAKRLAANATVLANLQAQLTGTHFTVASTLNADLRAVPPGGTSPTDGSTASLEQFLITNKISYRIFTTDVVIKAAKWSTAQTN